jgi:NAD(P)-dependent dehydrogenase (short-subunit alcohol dehydrogenase family)
MSHQDKVAIVTGAGSGIGAATARRLATAGARVVIVDRDGATADRVAASAGPDTIAVRADVSVEADVEGYMSAARERFGRVDLLHLNAGIAGPFEPFPQVETAEFDHVIAVNLRSVFLGLRAGLREFERAGHGGAIVVTSSLAGLHGGDSLVPYTAAKHGVIGLVKNASSYGARIGVRVNAIAPGIIVTGLMDELQSQLGDRADAALGALRTAIPLGRFGTPEEAAALVAFLLSDEASYLTGTVIPIDGGVLAANPMAAERSAPEPVAPTRPEPAPPTDTDSQGPPR